MPKPQGTQANQQNTHGLFPLLVVFCWLHRNLVDSETLNNLPRNQAKEDRMQLILFYTVICTSCTHLAPSSHVVTQSQEGAEPKTLCGKYGSRSPCRLWQSGSPKEGLPGYSAAKLVVIRCRGCQCRMGRYNHLPAGCCFSGISRHWTSLTEASNMMPFEHC